MIPETKNKYFEKYQEHLKSIDEIIQVVLKGHLIIEEILSKIIEKFVFHSEHLEECDLSFYKKVQLARALCPQQNQDTVWNLILSINSLRNELAHSLQSNDRKRKTDKVKQLLLKELENESDLKNLKNERDPTIFATACSLCIGFLESFKKDAEEFREMVCKTMARIKPYNKKTL